ncbi:MAG: tRNA (adenosine(37)-N6)-threonylcarbamoyltransferase complex ATPase subunit type 1 TsaE [Bauldia sp.]
MPAAAHHSIALPDAAATEALARRLAPLLVRGDVIALSGGLGAGKTTFARALIRALAADSGLEVPSPTFTLVQSYPEAEPPIGHFDLYRVKDATELDELGLDDAAASGVAIVEWPERAPSRIAASALHIAFELAGRGRVASLRGDESWQERLRTLVGSFAADNRGRS